MSQPPTGGRAPEERTQEEQARWLDDPRNVSRIVYALYAACVLLFIADFFYHKHVKFDFEGWTGFYGWFGFFSYLFIVLSAKQLRKVLRRDESYYDPDETAVDPATEDKA